MISLSPDLLLWVQKLCLVWRCLRNTLPLSIDPSSWCLMQTALGKCEPDVPWCWHVTRPSHPQPAHVGQRAAEQHRAASVSTLLQIPLTPYRHHLLEIAPWPRKAESLYSADLSQMSKHASRVWDLTDMPSLHMLMPAVPLHQLCLQAPCREPVLLCMAGQAIQEVWDREIWSQIVFPNC